MKNIAVFPGSFDPVTKGHQSIVLRALPLFDEIIVAVGVNSSKEYFFTLEQRLDWLGKVFAKEPKIRIEQYQGLTIDFCKAQKAQFILRGLRTSADFEFERGIAQMNRVMYPEVDTVFILSTPELSSINSTIVRDILRNAGDVTQFVPKEVDLS